MSHVAVTNTSTAVLTLNSEVYVFMNYEYFKVNIQTGPISSPSPFVIRNMSATRFTKLTSGLYQYAVITNDGDVYKTLFLMKQVHVGPTLKGIS
jgi:hypothetical protein